MIKLVLIAVILLMLLYGLRHRKHVGLQAGRRILLVALAAFAILSVIDPRLTTSIANLLGVDRGTDLVLYALVVTFAFTAAGFYFKIVELEGRFVDLVRALALADAERLNQPDTNSDRPT
jgi:hypothetical protein